MTWIKPRKKLHPAQPAGKSSKRKPQKRFAGCTERQKSDRIVRLVVSPAPR
jgi:hypothetical protein